MKCWKFHIPGIMKFRKFRGKRHEMTWVRISYFAGGAAICFQFLIFLLIFVFCHAKLQSVLRNSSEIPSSMEHRLSRTHRCYFRIFCDDSFSAFEHTYEKKNKEKLDAVDSEMRVTDVTSLFGPYQNL